MKINKFLSLFAVILFISIAFTLPVSASTSSVIYKNDFTSGEASIDSSFNVYRGVLSITQEKENKFLRCTQENNRVQFAYGPQEESNVDINFKLRATTINNNNSSWFEAMFRSPHIPAWETVTYSVRLNTFQASLLYVDRFADENERTTISSNEEFKLKSGLWNNIQISTRGERMIVYVNGVQLFEGSDSQYGEAGGFGFVTNGMSFDVDDIVITKHSGKSIPEPVPNQRPEWAGDISETEEPDIADTGVIRIDLTTLGQEKVAVNNAIHFLNPFEYTIYTWIALGIAVLCLASAIAGIFIFKKYSERRKFKK